MKLEELKKFNGKDGNPAYIAYKGKVYDVSASKFWKGGIHMRKVEAGSDLTSQLSAAPHSEEQIFRYPVVAELEVETAINSESKVEYYQKLYHKFHPHPISVHFPMGIFPFAFFAQVISIFLGYNESFSFAAVLAMVVATLFTIPAALSGVLSFVLNYRCKLNIYLKVKLILTVVLFIVGVIGSYVGVTTSAYSVVFSATTLIVMPLVMVIGFCGGRLTWPN